MTTKAKRATVVAVTKRGWEGITLTFANGKTLEVNPSALDEATMQAAAVHGLVQKFVDAAALSRDADTGQPATIAEKFAAVEAVVTRVKANGPWNEKASGPRGLLFMALCEVYPNREPESLRKWLGEKTPAERKALERNAKIQPIYDRLVAAAATSDGEDILAELDEEADEEADTE